MEFIYESIMLVVTNKKKVDKGLTVISNVGGRRYTILSMSYLLLRGLLITSMACTPFLNE